MASKEGKKEDGETVELGGKSYKQFADGKYDVVILGTGLTNSLLAAILASKKKLSVLHIDKNSYYGGEGASLQIGELHSHFGKEASKEELTKKFGSTRGYNIDLIPKLIMAKGKLLQYLVKQNVEKYVEFNILDGSYVYQKGGTIGKVPATAGEAVSTSLVGFFQKRRLKSFLSMLHGLDEKEIELKPSQTVDFQDGPLGLKIIPLIPSTKVGSTVTSVGGQAAKSGKIKVGDILTHIAGKDVRGFTHADILGLIKKSSRPLAVTFQSPPAVRGKWDLVTHSAKELYEYWVLDENTQDFVNHAMGLYPNDDNLAQPAFYTVAALCLYKDSALRYGQSPFLFPKYGLSEMPQGFSRLCALQGGVQSLRIEVNDVVVDEDSGAVDGVVLKYEGVQQAVKTTRVIASPEYFSKSGVMGSGSWSGKMRSIGKVVRSICILDHPIDKTGDGNVQIILPQKQTGWHYDTYITCMGDKFKVAPKGKFVAIVSKTVETDEPMKEISQAINLLGSVMARFDKVSDILVPASGEDGERTNVFCSSSFDATSHFETVISDVGAVYQKITGERLDLTA